MSEKYSENFKKLEAKLKEHNIEIDDALSKEMFESHMLAFWERLKNNEQIDDDSYKAILSEIKDENLEIAKEITGLFTDDEVLMMEIVLVATHIQAYFDKKEEEKI